MISTTWLYNDVSCALKHQQTRAKMALTQKQYWYVVYWYLVRVCATVCVSIMLNFSSSTQGCSDSSGAFSAAASDPATAPLRASAPAATSSALDKAMSFLNKYSTPPTGAATKGINVATRLSGTANTDSDDEDEMDISLSSEDMDTGQTFPRKVQSRLKASGGPDELGKPFGQHQVSRSLTGVRSSARFATAKELGVSGLGALAGPKASVSPLGLQNQHVNTVDTAGSRFETDKHSQLEDGRVSGLLLSVNIPGGSPDSAAVKHERGSDGEVASSVESIHSAVAGTLEEIRQEAQAVESGQRQLGSACPELGSSREFDDEGSSGPISPTFEPEGAILKRALPHDKAHSSTMNDNDRGFVHTALRKVISGEHLAAVSGQHAEPTLSRRDGQTINYDYSGGREDASVGYRVRNVDEMEDDEDDYEDDCFEEVDGNTESEVTPPAAGRNGANLAGVVLRRSASCEADPATGWSGGGSNICSSDEGQHGVQRHTPMTSSVPEPLVDNSVHSGEYAMNRKPRQVWNNLAPPGKSRVPETTESGTSPVPQSMPGTPASHDNGRGTSPGSNPIPSGKALLDIKQAWDGRSASGSQVDDSNSAAAAASTPTEYMNGGGVARYPPQGADEFRREMPAAVDGVSKKGVLIDRSAERRSPDPPPGTDIKVVRRAETVASVEYTHDPERGLTLRSCGTQVIHVVNRLRQRRPSK